MPRYPQKGEVARSQKWLQIAVNNATTLLNERIARAFSWTDDYYIHWRSPRCGAPDDIEALTTYDWPGNIRELQHVVERAVILAEGGRIRLDLALPQNRGPSEAKEPRAPAPSPTTGVVTDEEMRRRERRNILAALEQAQGKLYGRGGAAELLSIKATTLASRMKALGIKRPRA